MAMSLSASTVPCLKSEQTVRLASSTRIPALSSLRFRFPVTYRKVRSANQRTSFSSPVPILDFLWAKEGAKEELLSKTNILILPLVKGSLGGSTVLSLYSKLVSYSSYSNQEPSVILNMINEKCELMDHFPFLDEAQAKKQTYSSFDDLLAESDKPVLVDFYATWCGPCQFMVPILNEVSATLKDKIQVVKVDTEKYPHVADKYRIEALPTFIIFKDGKPHDRFEGALTANQLVQRIEESLKVKK